VARSDGPGAPCFDAPPATPRRRASAPRVGAELRRHAEILTQYRTFRIARINAQLRAKAIIHCSEALQNCRIPSRLQKGDAIMTAYSSEVSEGCKNCAETGRTRFEQAISMAFQPIVHADGRVFAHEALVRGPNGEGAGMILGQVTDENRYNFDQKCRVRAIQQYKALGAPAILSINFLPNAVYEPKNCIRQTIAAATRCNLDIRSIMFEITEQEKITDIGHLNNIFREYKSIGFKTAIDDFGAGYSGLNLLSMLQPDVLKLDMGLVRDLDTSRPKQAIVRGIMAVCDDLGIAVVGEGVETADERDALFDFGVTLMQGYLFARPMFEGLPALDGAAFGGARPVRD
jgi:EAL domain-containing protein (putative c-di-GMP-specific phosphodiesterase class I)